MKRRQVLTALASAPVFTAAAGLGRAAAATTGGTVAAARVTQAIPLVPGSSGTTGRSPMVVGFEFMLTANPGEDPPTGSGSFKLDFRSSARTKNAALVSAVREAAFQQFGVSLGERDVAVWSAFAEQDADR